jgi:FkbH-like protein
MVFLDDNPGERAWVRERHAEVLVPEMPEDRTRYVDILCDCQLDNLGVTDEDLKRSRMYWEERQRRALQAETPSFEDFLRSLNLEVEIEPVRPETMERAAQLCQRTNQFNVTTRRHNAGQLDKFSTSPDSRVLMMRARDRFGDYGWSGLVIATVEGEFAVVDSFLLSCRVLGKNAEFALFAALAKWAAGRNCTQIRGCYIPTSKNAPCKDFFAKCGLKPVRAVEGATPGQVFEARLSETQLPQVDFIKTSVNP